MCHCLCSSVCTTLATPVPHSYYPLHLTRPNDGWPKLLSTNWALRQIVCLFTLQKNNNFVYRGRLSLLDTRLPNFTDSKFLHSRDSPYNIFEYRREKSHTLTSRNEFQLVGQSVCVSHYVLCFALLSWSADAGMPWSWRDARVTSNT